MQAESKKAIYAAFGANLGVAVAKFIGFGITGAASMLAEAVHSVADTGNQGLLLFGRSRAKRAASFDHPFGYGMERYFWAFVVAVVIFFLGGVFAISEGIEKLMHPHELKDPLVAVGILVAGLILEGLSLATAVRETNKVRGSLSMWQFVKHTKNAELPVVLLEDFGALVGLSLALIGIGIAYTTGDPRFDAAGSLAIGVLLCIISIILAREMRSLLTGEAARPEQLKLIRDTLESNDRVKRIIHMRTMHFGPTELLVAAKLEFDHSLSFDELTACINRIEAAVREAIPLVKNLYIEPDIYRPPEN
ncbi:MAG: cation transporter [Deltaproteobacteria bacterium]|nr:cation transporter [Deltaproteobacteria bacterium]